MTSFAFMFDEVPEPVWKTSIGNWSSSSPLGDPVGGGGDALGLLRVEQPELGVHARGGGLDAARASARRAPGIGSPETWKFSTAFFVSPPQSSSMAPSLSRRDIRHRRVRGSSLGSQRGGGGVRLN